jgi:hypothetical protein
LGGNDEYLNVVLSGLPLEEALGRKSAPKPSEASSNNDDFATHCIISKVGSRKRQQLEEIEDIIVITKPDWS